MPDRELRPSLSASNYTYRFPEAVWASGRWALQVKVFLYNYSVPGPPAAAVGAGATHNCQVTVTPHEFLVLQ